MLNWRLTASVVSLCGLLLSNPLTMVHVGCHQFSGSASCTPSCSTPNHSTPDGGCGTEPRKPSQCCRSHSHASPAESAAEETHAGSKTCQHEEGSPERHLPPHGHHDSDACPICQCFWVSRGLHLCVAPHVEVMRAIPCETFSRTSSALIKPVHLAGRFDRGPPSVSLCV